jgi:hypothetical protein
MVSMTHRDGLDRTIASLELRADAAAVVAMAQQTAERLDECVSVEIYARLVSTYLRQLKELAGLAVAPEILPEEDPFDALARKLGEGVS